MTPSEITAARDRYADKYSKHATRSVYKEGFSKAVSLLTPELEKQERVSNSLAQSMGRGIGELQERHRAELKRRDELLGECEGVLGYYGNRVDSGGYARTLLTKLQSRDKG